MKNLLNSAWRCNGKSFAIHQSFGVIRNTALFSCSMILIFLFTACKKQGMNEPLNELQSTIAKTAEAEVLNMYSGFSQQTLWELKQARAGTAKYRNIDNAIKDGYVDIAVDVEHMGHHYMKASLVDATFDIRNPELLVYNRNEKGIQELVAVEYAVPLTNPRPEGFTGSADVWDGNAGFQLWLLHAWVWSYNPDGVFNPTNPLVHLQ